MNKNELLKKFQNFHIDKNGIFKKIKNIHKENPYTVNDYTTKKTQVCFIFSCPGYEELINNKVCCGKTGDNLDILLNILHSIDKNLFPSTNRYDYDILNSSNVVHYYALDNKTEPEKSEILNNKVRIFNYIDSNKQLKYIVLFGKKADNLSTEIKKHIDNNNLKMLIIKNLPHLGYQSINQIKKDENNKSINEKNYPTPEERTKARLKVIANKIINQIKDSQNGENI